MEQKKLNKLSVLVLCLLVVFNPVSASGSQSQNHDNLKAKFISGIIMKHPVVAKKIWNLGLAVMFNNGGYTNHIGKNTTKAFVNYALDNIPSVLNNRKFKKTIKNIVTEISKAYKRSKVKESPFKSGTLTKKAILEVAKHVDFRRLVLNIMDNLTPFMDAVFSTDTSKYSFALNDTLNIGISVWKSEEFQKVKAITIEELLQGYLVVQNATDFIINVLKHTNFPRLSQEVIKAVRPFVEKIIGKDSTEKFIEIGLIAKMYTTLSKDDFFQSVKNFSLQTFWETFNRTNITIDDFISNPSGAIKNVLMNVDKAKLLLDLANHYTANRRNETTLTNRVNNQCIQDTKDTIHAMFEKKLWAMKVLDSFGKLGSGIKRGHLNMVGSYEECKSVKAVITETVDGTEKETRTFRTKYCRVTMNKPEGLFNFEDRGFKITFTWGLCVPDSCYAYDIDNFLNATTFNGLQIWIQNAKVVCSEEKNLTKDIAVIIAIVVLSLFGVLILVATLVEFLIMQKQKWCDSYHLQQISATEASDSNGYQNKGRNRENSTEGNEEKSCTSPLSILKCHFTIGRGNDEGISTNEEHIRQGHSVGESRDICRYKQNEAIDVNNDKDVSIKNGKCLRILSAFALQPNIRKLISGKTGNGSITCINGIRFLTLTWIIQAHLPGYGMASVPGLPTTDNAIHIEEVLQRLSGQAALAAVLAVDTFFMISGMLVMYLQLEYVEKLMKKLTCSKTINYAVKYITHRVWRLSPFYIAVLLFVTCLLSTVSDGPFWPENFKTAENCKTYWWTNLLYINNFVPAEKQCMEWTWFLGDDMQFYLLSLLLLPVVAISLKMGVFVISVIMVGGICTAATMEYTYGGDIRSIRLNNEYFDHVYKPPWCRVPSYCVGLLLGILLVKKKDRKLHWVNCVLGWIIATILALFIVYIPYTELRKSADPWPLYLKAAYESVGRPLWTACVAWVVFACHSGYGGIVNKILSWNGFVPFSRLTYGAYLLHPVVIMVQMYSKKSLFYVNDVEYTYIVIGHTVVTFVAAFVGSLAFEAPFIALEKILFR